MRRRLITGAVSLAALVLAAAGVAGPTGSSGARPKSRLPGGTSSASEFTSRVTNPYFPLLPGMRWVYRGSEDHVPARNVVTVTNRVKRIGGVPCAVVDDRIYLGGRLEERTTDWYTQRRNGDVWYYGEATMTFKRDGSVKSREGSWRAGVDGARPGIFMPARPQLGQSFQQESYPGHAEDHFKVVSKHATIRVPYGAYKGTVLMTREFTPLEPGVLDGKWYARGVGQVAERSLKGGSESFKLVSFHRR